MSAVPAEIAGFGSTQQRLRPTPGFDLSRAGVGPEEYFVWSRIDGTQTLREVLLATGLPIDRAVSILQRLRSIGAVLLPGETKAPPPPPPPRAAPQPPTTGPHLAIPRTLTPMRQVPSATGPIHDLTLDNPSADEVAALSEANDLSDTERRRILAITRLLELRDPHAILGVPSGSDARTITRAYHLLSKEVHPDSYYGKQLGSFKQRLAVVFEATTRAYNSLTRNRVGQQATTQSATDAPQTKQEYAAELFQRGCQLEESGDASGAMRLFAAAVGVDPQLRYLRRAASCALVANQPKTSLEYAKKAQGLAPNDPSAARLLATAFRADNRLSDAEEVLVMALAIKSENDVLTNELRHDLAEVRRLLAQ